MANKRLGEVIERQGQEEPKGLSHNEKSILKEEDKDTTEKRTAKTQSMITPTEKRKITELRGYQSESDFIRDLIIKKLNENK